jgi:NhaA family Na+:H+ antiporter
VTWRGVAVVGAVAGIGFTMALFIARLAFAESSAVRDVATVVVLSASAVAAVFALILGRALLPRGDQSSPDESGAGT